VNPFKHMILTLGLSVASLVLLGSGAAFARAGGGGFHGGGFHGGGGFHAAPAFHGGFGARAAPLVHAGVGFRGIATAPVHGVGFYRGGLAGGGYRPLPAPGFTVGPRYHGSLGRAWIPGYWGFRGGARVWIAGAYVTGPYPGWIWVAPHWSWNGFQWVWLEGTWAPPAY
jgi:hypothetical protein